MISGGIFDGHSLGRRVAPYLLFNGKRPGRLLNMRQCPGKTSMTKNYLSQNVNTAEAWKLLISLLSQKIGSS